MRFRFIEEHGRGFPTNRLCKVLEVSERGLRAYRSRPASRRQRTEMVVLTHIKERSRLSLGSYGRPRITEVLTELGLNIGPRRVGRLMRENDIRVERFRRYKVTIITRQAIAKQSVERGTATTLSTSHLTCWTGTSAPTAPTRNGRATSATPGPAKPGSTSP